MVPCEFSAVLVNSHISTDSDFKQTPMHTLLQLAVFTTHPNNITEIIGKNVTFNCAARDGFLEYIEWIVLIPAVARAKRFDTSSLKMVAELTARGFILGDLIESGNNRYHINLTIPAFTEHNNTEVRCRYLRHGDSEFSNLASLKILGELSCIIRLSFLNTLSNNTSIIECA